MYAPAVFVCLSLAGAVAAEDWASLWRDCRAAEDAGGCLERRVRKDIVFGDGLVLRSAEERQGRSVEGGGLYSRLAELFSGREFVLTLPSFTGRQLEDGIEEGRGKMKKMMGSMMMLGAMKGMMVIPMMLGMLFLLAGKAFVIAKVALVLALVVTLKKLVASKQSDGGHGGGGWDRRSLSSHQLAYSAYAP